MSMNCIFIAALLGLCVSIDPLPAQERIQRGTIKKVDADKGVFTVTENTRIAGVPGKTLEEQLKSKELKPGVEVQFLSAMREGKTVLVGLRLGGGGGDRPAPVKVDTSKFKPLPELGKDEYKGF